MRAAAWLVACAGVAAPATHAADKATGDKAIKLFEDATGSPLQFKDFFVNDSALQVSAAALAGVAPSAVNIAESVNDVAVFLQGLDSKSKGSGFSIAPARIRKPWPRIELQDYLDRKPAALLLSNLSLSYAQGNGEIDSTKVRRHAVSLSTGGSFFAEDDPIEAMVVALAANSGACGKAERDKLGAAVAVGQGEAEAKVALKKALLKCVDDAQKKLDQRWFRPIWSVAVGTGDIRTDASGSRTVRQGTAVALAARYGRGIKPGEGTSSSEEFAWGWSIAGSFTWRKDEPVVSTLDSAQVQRVDTKAAALKLSAGTDVWRAVGEVSNVGRKGADAGDRTMKQALGIDYKLGEGWWLNFRYGKRERAGGAGEEAASLLSLTISPSKLF